MNQTQLIGKTPFNEELLEKDLKVCGDFQLSKKHIQSIAKQLGTIILYGTMMVMSNYTNTQYKDINIFPIN